MSRLPLALASILALTVGATPWRASAQHSRDHAAAASTVPQGVPKGAKVVEIAVTKEGFVPAEVTVKAGKPVALVVTRKVQRTCATEIVLKDFGANKALPLDQAVTVVVTPKKAGTYRFACGMEMIAGQLHVQ